MIPLGANPISTARGINNKTEIVGDNAQGTAFYWKDGNLRDLGTSPNSTFARSEAHDINEAGRIVGGTCFSPGCPALLWEPDGTLTELPDLPGGPLRATAFAINERGEIVGIGADTDIGHAATSWQGDTVEPLGHDRAATDINERGQIVGDSETTVQRAATWRFFHEFAALPVPLGMFSSSASAINERAEIVGLSTVNFPTIQPLRATLWQEGRVADLNELIACDALPPGLVLRTATDINERGQIAVNANATTAASGNEWRAFLLTPVSARDPCN